GAGVVGAGELDGDASNTGLAGVLHAVVEAGGAGVGEDAAAQLAQPQFAEVVIPSVHPRRQVDVGDLVAGRGAARRAHGFLAVQPAGRLGFGQGVGSGPQLVELVSAVGAGLDRLVDGGAGVVLAVQRHRDPGDAGLVRLLDAVVVALGADVGVDEPGQRGGAQLGAVVVQPLAPRRQGDAAEDVAAQL